MYRAPQDPQRIAAAPIHAWHGDAATARDDLLAVEEPLQLRLGPDPLAVLMRTPGHDDELAAGFLHAEGIIASAADIAALHIWRDHTGALADNTVTITLAPPAERVPGPPGASPDDPTRTPARRFTATASCGLCGTDTIDAALRLALPLPHPLTVPPALLYPLPQRLRDAQAVFAHTGGLHAAALFDLHGTLLALREDIGRHNAVDKLIGRALLDHQLPLHDRILLVSGRVSFEIVQKALQARIPLIAAISAPTSLAVQAARRANLTLVGFLRDGRLNVYR